MSLLLVEMTAATDSAGTTTTLRVATEGYNHPSAPGFYQERIEESGTPNIRRELRGDGGGRGTISFSDLILLNADGDLDDWETYGFDGRQIKALLLDDVNTDYSNATTLFTATMAPPSFTLMDVTIPIRDRLQELEVDLHSDTYDGSNTLPNGLEGTESDIQGQPKPEPEGLPFNVQPPFVNTSRLIYQFSNGDQEADIIARTNVGPKTLDITNGDTVDGAADDFNHLEVDDRVELKGFSTSSNNTVVTVGSVAGDGSSFTVRGSLTNETGSGDEEALQLGGVYEGGIGLVRESDYTDQSDMESNAPSQGAYRVWPRSGSPLSGGYFRLGSNPTHTITCDPIVGASSSDRQVGSVLESLALRADTITSSDINSTDVNDLNTALSYPVELWQTGESTILSEMDRIAAGAGVYFGFDRDGVLRMGEWSAPSSTAVATFRQADPASGELLATDEFDLEDIEGEQTIDRDRPTYKVTIKFRRNYTVQAELQTDIGDARRALIESPWRRDVSQDTSIKDKHKNARSATIESAFATRSGASDVGDTMLARDKPQRRRWRLMAALTNELDQTIDLADTIEVVLDRLAFSGGANYRIRALDLDPVAGRLEADIWG